MTHPKRITLVSGLRAGVAALALLAAAPGPAEASPDGATWSPAASERLVKLPPHMLKKAVDRDFQASGLAVAIGDAGTRITAKSQTLRDLRDAATRADGDLRLELQHQFLAEKQVYIQMVGERLELRARQAETRKVLYERLLEKLRLHGAADDPVTADLVARQEAARQRFDRSVDAVDMQVFGGEFAPQSRYGAEYAKNQAAMDRLLTAIEAHPMNQRPMLDGEEVTREDYLRQLVADAEAERALVAQEEQLLGYMAKLVALDAMALAENLAAAEGGGEVVDGGAEPSLAANVDLFVDNEAF